MPPTSQAQPQCHLLRLPAELRDCIYALVLTPPSINQLRQTSTRNHYSNYAPPPIHLTPALLRVCRQVNAEATPILYADNTFAAHPSLLTGLPFLLTRSAPVTHGRGKALIRRWSLAVRLDTDPGFSARAVEAAFSGAEELEVDVFQAMFGSCDFSVLRLFEGVRGVRRAAVRGSVGDGRYAEWLAGVMMLPAGQAVGEARDSGWQVENGHTRSVEWDPWMGNR